ncbi:MAG: Lrp/AsnC family transcriptional regulator [Deltaproteobacteria bacterium]|nr:Lrp/AsnC family transcriptional regulator [Deltaproteobacteria bacterium]MBW2661109.1 Lrp/AsnC family transcriptional regulator [Deltaproteobacteria bacterium]
MLTKLEKMILASIQGDISITQRPYLKMAEQLGISEDTFLEKLKDLCDRGVIRRFGATIRHQKSGFKANAMVAWEVDEKRIIEVGEKMASFRQVSHCYRRNPTERWHYNLYTMIHAMDEETCLKTARKISEATSVNTYTLLFSRQELKKTSMQYFTQDASECED